MCRPERLCDAARWQGGDLIRGDLRGSGIQAARLERRGARFEEYVRCVREVGGPDPVEFQGGFYTVPRSEIGPKPVRGKIPLVLGGFAEPTLERAGRLADGWTPVFTGSFDPLAKGIELVRNAAAKAGRDVASLECILRVNTAIVSETPFGSDRSPFTGTVAEIADDVRHAGELGVTEVFFDVNPPHDIEGLPGIAGTEATLRVMEQLAGVV